MFVVFLSFVLLAAIDARFCGVIICCCLYVVSCTCSRVYISCVLHLFVDVVCVCYFDVFSLLLFFFGFSVSCVLCIVVYSACSYLLFF